MPGEWLQWYNLIFIIPAAVSILVLLLSGLGGHGGHGHSATGHAHGVGDMPAGHAHGLGDLHGGHAHGAGDLHGTHGHASGHDGGASGHAHGHHDAGVHHEGIGLAQRTLSFFAVGRAPVTIVLGSMMLGWGLCGYITVGALQPVLRFPAAFVPPALGIAVGGGLLFAKVFGEIAAHLIPQEESSAVSVEDLVGLFGTVVYPVSDTEGRIHVFDAFRTLHVEPAHVAPGAASIAKGTSVKVTAISPDGDYLIVTPADDAP
jgi:hypothetical protein